MNQKPNINIRPPIVTILGHVDHGKTTLLDTIRKTNVVAREHGGITQHIGAYQITHNGQPITFIDTPGHAAFEKMRSRGAEVADIAILVVAANDSVKPQTTEAIKHIKKAGIPYIVAITKTDLENINVDKVKKDLQGADVLVESFGGTVPVVEIAAIKGKGIVELLEIILLVWQMSPQPSLPNDPLEAIVVESYLDKNRGSIVSVIVKKGTLRVGQGIEVDEQMIKVKALVDDKGKTLSQALPSTPVEILGFRKVLGVGSIVREKIKTKGIEKKIATHQDIIEKSLLAKDKFKVILKADVLGSLEAIKANLPEKLLVIFQGVGDVQTTDVNFAKGAKAPILAFNVQIPTSVQKLADGENVVIRKYRLIYELIEDMQSIAESFEKTKHEVKIKGKAQIVAVFDIEGKKVAGLKVTNGKIKVGDKVIVRNSSGEGQETNVTSLKKFRKNVEAVTYGQECGIAFATNLDFKEGDIVESLG
ncbi:translation initiation factor IF-2 [Candidatus Curtissbacteria bacterium RIFCSPLOWO2_01_FULL_38_11b]|uniref:Translation initiation factor IF-2 n=1 Tax=Candidatus Curtissbacteria bacterium RIFCSPLOWO2_01_FULL_38_11b TaxID=1797725 RepID=A0A1F5GYX7_9BACT|nr:MAG: translation initiation factor IF-2 [Candidatus Curtissbacteria bacterium RIFCSPLOWO2_01_FULL_38_11b]